MSGLKYVRFRDLIHWDPTKSSELLSSIRLHLSPTKQLVSNTKTLLQIEHHDQPVSNANGEVAQWFVQHRLSTKLRDLFDFQTREEMLNYADLLTQNRNRQLEIYGQIYAEKYAGEQLAPHEFLRFSSALEKLLREERPTAKSQLCSIS